MSDEVNEELEYAEVPINSNTIYLTGAITSDNSDGIISYILAENLRPAEERLTSINLFINSPGGDMLATFAMISMIRASSIPVRTIAIGSCASGGLMLAISGQIRLVDKYCSIMSHTLSTGYPEYAKPEALQSWLDDVHVQKQKIITLYEESTGMPQELIMRELLPSNSDRYLSAELAIEYNLFDGCFEDFDQIRDE